MIYNYKLFLENVQQSKTILRGLGKKETDPNYLRIREMLMGKDGYVGLFTKLHFRNVVKIFPEQSISRPL